MTIECLHTVESSANTLYLCEFPHFLNGKIVTDIKNSGKADKKKVEKWLTAWIPFGFEEFIVHIGKKSLLGIKLSPNNYNGDVDDDWEKNYLEYKEVINRFLAEIFIFARLVFFLSVISYFTFYAIIGGSALKHF